LEILFGTVSETPSLSMLRIRKVLKIPQTPFIPASVLGLFSAQAQLLLSIHPEVNFAFESSEFENHA